MKTTKKFQRILALVLSLSMIMSNLLIVSAAETQKNVDAHCYDGCSRAGIAVYRDNVV